MRRTTLRIVAALPALSMLPPAVVLAEDKAALMRTGELACNDLCRRWMSLGQPHETVPTERDAPTSTAAPSATEPREASRPNVLDSQAVRSAAGPAAPPHLRAKVARQVEQPRPAVTASIALPSTVHRPLAVGFTPLTTEVQPGSPPPAMLASSGIKTVQSNHRAPSSPAGQAAETTVQANSLVEDPEDALGRVETVAWVGPSEQTASQINASDAEVITGALSAGTLLAMALLPLTSRPRRSGNPALWATLRASRRQNL